MKALTLLLTLATFAVGSTTSNPTVVLVHGALGYCSSSTGAVPTLEERESLRHTDMLKVGKSTVAGVVFKPSGRMNAEDVGEVESLFNSETTSLRIALDLEDLTLGAQQAVRFLADRETQGVVLRNCPAYSSQPGNKPKSSRSRRLR